MPDALASVEAPPPKRKGIDWSIGRKDVTRTLGDVKRLGELIASGVNNAVVGTAAIPADLGVAVRNVATGEDYQRPSQMFADWQARSIAPPKDTVEQLINAGAGFAFGAKLPVPGGGKAPPPAVSPKAESAMMARDAGFKLPPSMVPQSSTLSRVAEKLAGPRKVAESAAGHNTEQLAKNFAKELELPKGTDITPDAISSVITRETKKGYEPIKRLGAQYSDLIDSIRTNRDKMRGLWADYRRNQRFETLEQAKGASAAVENAESVLEGVLKQTGNPQLAEGYFKSRQMIAKAGDIERALVESTGGFSAPKLARQFASGGRSGAVETAGRSAEAFPKVMKPPASSPSISFANRVAGGAGLLGMGASAAIHTPMVGKAGGALLAGTAAKELGQTGLRSALMGDAAQDAMVYLTPEQRREALARSLAAVIYGSASQ